MRSHSHKTCQLSSSQCNSSSSKGTSFQHLLRKIYTQRTPQRRHLLRQTKTPLLRHSNSSDRNTITNSLRFPRKWKSSAPTISASLSEATPATTIESCVSISEMHSRQQLWKITKDSSNKCKRIKNSWQVSHSSSISNKQHCKLLSTVKLVHFSSSDFSLPKLRYHRNQKARHSISRARHRVINLSPHKAAPYLLIIYRVVISRASGTSKCSIRKTPWLARAPLAKFTRR